MTVQMDTEQMRSLFEDFYVLTGIMIALFDRDYHQLLSFPENGTEFCFQMRQNKGFLEHCHKSDCVAFQKCNQTKKLIIYTCHAGLTEAVTPILEGNATAGYLMFGQVTDQRKKTSILEQIAPYDHPAAEALVKKIKYKSRRQIVAASKILDACTNYIIQKEMLASRPDDLFFRVNAYLDSHLQEDLSVNRLCRQFHINRTRLYELLAPDTGGGIARYIKEKRLNRAKELLKTTDLSVVQIAEQAGISDYNYFCRIFKKSFGISAKAYRKKYRDL